jgi:hypothetical protein
LSRSLPRLDDVALRRSHLLLRGHVITPARIFVLVTVTHSYLHLPAWFPRQDLATLFTS